MPIEIAGKSFCITGKISEINEATEKPYTRAEVSTLIEQQGGIIKKSVIRSLDYLVIGGLGSDKYLEGTKGTKYIKAEQQENTQIISDTELFKVLKKSST